MKGISPVIASILLILITISLAGGYLVFTGRLAGDVQESAEEQAAQARELTTTLFSISSVSDQSVVVRNNGQQTIEPNALRVTLDDNDVNYTMQEPIAPGETGALVLDDLWKLELGEYRLRVTGSAKSDSMTVRLQPNDDVTFNMRFEEGVGTQTFDTAGGRTGTFANVTGSCSSTGCPSWTEGRFGKALKFDAVGDFIKTDARTDVVGITQNSFTVEAWLKADSWTLDIDPLIYDNIVIETHDAHNGKQLYLVIRTKKVYTGFWGTNHIGSTELANNTWYHVVWRYNTGTREITHFLNGDQDSSGILSEHYTGIGTVLIGGVPTGTWGLFNGTIDEVRVYNDAFAPDELYVLEEL